jgi:hypothetical protein
LLEIMEGVQQVLHGMIGMVLKLAPLAAFGAVAFVIGRYGLSSVLPLLRFVAAIYLVSILFVCIVMGLVARAAGCNIFRLIAYVKEELLLVVFTSSSMAALPGLVEKMEKMGCAKAVVRLVLPTGYSFNLSGTNIYIAMAALFLAQAAHVELGFWQLLSLLGVSLLTSKSATSVAGSAFVALAATLASLSIIPVAGIVLLLGVERLMKCRSLTNVIGNCVACVVVCAWEKSLDRRAMHQALSGKALSCRRPELMQAVAQAFRAAFEQGIEALGPLQLPVQRSPLRVAVSHADGGGNIALHAAGDGPVRQAQAAEQPFVNVLKHFRPRLAHAGQADRDGVGDAVGVAEGKRAHEHVAAAEDGEVVRVRLVRVDLGVRQIAAYQPPHLRIDQAGRLPDQEMKAYLLA